MTSTPPNAREPQAGATAAWEFFGSIPVDQAQEVSLSAGVDDVDRDTLLHLSTHERTAQSSNPSGRVPRAAHIPLRL